MYDKIIIITFCAMMETGNSIPYFGEILALITALTWAVAVILFKRSGESVHPIALNLFKNILAFFLFIPTIYLSGDVILRSVPMTDYWILIISGILGIGFGDTLFFKSLNLLGAGMQSIVGCLYSPSIIILSFFWLSEKMTGLQIIGAILIVSAVLTAISRKKVGGISRRNLVLGITWAVLAHLISGVGVVMIKNLLEQSPVLWVTEIRLFGGIVVLLIILLLHPRKKPIVRSLNTSRSWIYTFSGSLLGAYLAMIFWLGGMKYTQASIAAALNQTSSIFVFVLAALVLKEPINMQRTIGIILGVSGALMVTFG